LSAGASLEIPELAVGLAVDAICVSVSYYSSSDSGIAMLPVISHHLK